MSIKINGIKRSIVLFCARMIIWQPWPCIAYTENELLSWWFYRVSNGNDSKSELNWLGTIWNKLWWSLSDVSRVIK